MKKMKNKWLCCLKAETTYPSPPTLSFACPPSLLLPPWFTSTNSPTCHSPGLCSLALPLTAPLVCICARVDSLPLFVSIHSVLGGLPSSMLVCACVPLFVPIHGVWGWSLSMLIHAYVGWLAFVCAWCKLSALVHAHSWCFGLFHPCPPLSMFVWISLPAFIHTCVALVHAFSGCFGLICPCPCSFAYMPNLLGLWFICAGPLVCV